MEDLTFVKLSSQKISDEIAKVNTKISSNKGSCDFGCKALFVL